MEAALVGEGALEQDVCGILAAGGSAAEVRGYLRREEEGLLGEARSEGPTRGSIAATAWRIVRGIE